MAGYNPSWLENMYMGKYETEEDRLKRLQSEQPTNSMPVNIGSDYRTYQTESQTSPTDRLKRLQSEQPTNSMPVNIGSDYRTYQTESQTSPTSNIMSGLSAASKDPETQDKAVSGKLGAADYVGLGLQLVGAMNADKEAKRQEEKDDKKYSEAKQSAARQREDELRQAQEQMQQQDRSQDMAGLNYLAQQRANAMQNRTAYSFRNNFAKALRG